MFPIFLIVLSFCIPIFSPKFVRNGKERLLCCSIVVIVGVFRGRSEADLGISKKGVPYCKKLFYATH